MAEKSCRQFIFVVYFEGRVLESRLMEMEAVGKS